MRLNNKAKRTRKGKKRNCAAMMAMAMAITITGSGIPNIMVQAAELAGEIDSPILITEVVPNTDNLHGADAWEYYEIKNISSQDVNLDNYQIIYDNGSQETEWKAEGINALPVGKTMVVWVKNDGNGDKEAADFREYYENKLGYQIPEEGLIATVSCGGLANSGTRTMYVRTQTGKTLSTIFYTAANSEGAKLDVDEAIEFQMNGGTVTPQYDRTPSPLEVSEGLVTGSYTAPAVIAEPMVETASNSSVQTEGSLSVVVEDTNLSLDSIINGTIQVTGGKSYPLKLQTDGQLAGEISGRDVAEASDNRFAYTVTITDGVNSAVSAEKEVRVIASSVDRSKAPELALTEIMPDSSNVNGADAYEYIELYNNSERAIDLKDYKLLYHYPDDNSDVIWWETETSLLLNAGDTLVFWVKNGSNDELTKDDFNQKFGTDLNEQQLIEISCGGMANGSPRGLRITSNVKDDIDFVTYNTTANVDDTTADQSITYQNQYRNGQFQTVMTSNCAVPTPGRVTETERPDYQPTLLIPETSPELVDDTVSEFDNQTENLAFDLKASSADTTIKTVRLYVKYNDHADYECYNLTRSGENQFVKTKSNIDLLNKSSFTYYFEVSDGYQTVRSSEKTIRNTQEIANAELNLTSGEKIAGTKDVIAKGNQLIVDGLDVSADTVNSINGAGKIVFDASQTDVFFKNAVAVGNDVLGIFNEGTYENWATYVYDVDAQYYNYEDKTITVAFHAGNKANVLEHNIENNDDFILKNIRMVMPDGETLLPTSFGARKGLGAIEHSGLEEQTVIDVTSEIPSQEKEIQMGDGTSKYEILYATFTIPEQEFTSVRYQWDTTKILDGGHDVSNGAEVTHVVVDNTAPDITTNMESGKLYHSGTIQIQATDEGDGLNVPTKVTALLDGNQITVPYEFNSLALNPGEHTLEIQAVDEMGNKAEKSVVFITPKESAEFDENVFPTNGTLVNGSPILSIKPVDEAGDTMTVAFKRGEHFVLADENKIQSARGTSQIAGEEASGTRTIDANGFPYETFTITVDNNLDENATVQAKWSGTSSNSKTYMYAYNTATSQWEKLEAAQTNSVDGEGKSVMTLLGDVSVKNHLVNGKVRIMVQNGEGYAPLQYEPTGENAQNVDETPRTNYAFTFAVESDTQYYNEQYDGNPSQDVDGKYQYQLDIHNWLIANRERMNIQYLFHDGDIIDDEPLLPEWQQADAAYKLLDQAGLPYGLLAGNHDVGHLEGDYTNYSTYFGEQRYAQNPWYGGSYKNNRGHYDLMTIDGIDFIMLYTGWGIGDEEIEWMNQVLAQYPERKAILNFHEYLLASGGKGEEPQRVHDEVVAKNENVCMVLSGHYHNAYTTVDEFARQDGSTRKVYNMLFDYQGLPEGGLGYMRLMHFDTENQKVIIRTYSPSLDDYDAAESAVPNAGNQYVVPNASLNGEENFEISFSDLGIAATEKTLTTTALDVNVYGTETIATLENVQSGTEVSYEWTDAEAGTNGWYAEVTDGNGGLSRTNVQYVTVVRKETPGQPEQTPPAITQPLPDQVSPSPTPLKSTNVTTPTVDTGDEFAGELAALLIMLSTGMAGVVLSMKRK